MAKFTFLRSEIKYLLTPRQYVAIHDILAKTLINDKYGDSVIQSLYFDTPDYRLIRTSNEKPKFKEKLRLRSYGRAKPSDEVFLEIKRKAKGVVYKRRIRIPEQKAYEFLDGSYLLDDSQISNELTYFKRFYGQLAPSFLLLYDRNALVDPTSDLRVTFDKNVRYRTERLNLHSGFDGKRLLPDGYVLMEIKTTLSIPLWLTKILSDLRIYKTSFSKCGEAYKDHVLTKVRQDVRKEQKIG